MHWLYSDVTETASVQAAFEMIATKFGGVDIVVSNAGIALSGAIAELPEATLRTSFEVNFLPINGWPNRRSVS